jgi:hypothetical protein
MIFINLLYSIALWKGVSGASIHSNLTSRATSQFIIENGDVTA